MAIHRASANLVPVMLNPVAKPSRVAKFGSGRSNPSSSTSSQTAAQGASRPGSTAEQVHTAFKYALAGLSSMGSTGTGTVAQPSTVGTLTSIAATSGTSMAQSSPEGQSGGVQQSGVAAQAQVEQQAGQALDLTA